MAKTAPRISIATIVLLAAISGIPVRLIAQQSSEMPFLTDRQGRVVRAESVRQGDHVFVRDESVGEEFPIDWFSASHPASFRAEASRSNPLLAAAESIYRLDASQRYRWFGEEDPPPLLSDVNVRIAKVSLVALSAIAYYRVAEANRAIAQSIEFINADSRRAKFRQRRTEFSAVASLTTIAFLAYAIYAYAYFGTDAAGADLNVAAEPASLRQYLELLRQEQSNRDDFYRGTQWQFAWAFAW
ncbi:MAG: hypothetical protein K1X75_06115 [Leptospirales bacterium]|nr:hypothetical protein [Leptospirales bacterium]